jgi:hypothetical protein
VHEVSESIASMMSNKIIGFFYRKKPVAGTDFTPEYFVPFL